MPALCCRACAILTRQGFLGGASSAPAPFDNVEEVVHCTMGPQKTAQFILSGEMVTFDWSLEARVTLCQAKKEEQTSHVGKKK